MRHANAKTKYTKSKEERQAVLVEVIRGVVASNTGIRS